MPQPVTAVAKLFHTGAQVVEREGEVAWITAGRLESEACRSEDPDGYEGEHREPDERWLLGELVDGDVASCEHRKPVDAVDGLVPPGICPQPVEVQLAAADDNVVVSEVVAGAEVALLQAMAPQRSFAAVGLVIGDTSVLVTLSATPGLAGVPTE